MSEVSKQPEVNQAGAIPEALRICVLCSEHLAHTGGMFCEFCEGYIASQSPEDRDILLRVARVQVEEDARDHALHHAGRAARFFAQLERIDGETPESIQRSAERVARGMLMWIGLSVVNVALWFGIYLVVRMFLRIF